MEDFIRRLLSTWTEADCHEVDLNLALYKYGVDSIGAANMSLRIRNGVGAVFEVKSPLCFEYSLTRVKIYLSHITGHQVSVG